MNQNIAEQVIVFLKRQYKYHRWLKIVTGLAAVVVFITIYMLILPAITMEKPKELICADEAHTHVAECYAPAADDEETELPKEPAESGDEKEPEEPTGSGNEKEPEEPVESGNEKEPEEPTGSGNEKEPDDTGNSDDKYLAAGELTAEGEDYTARAVYKEDAQLPIGTELVVREITEDDSEYDINTEDVTNALLAGKPNVMDLDNPDDIEVPIITELRLFDISFVCGDEVIKPAAPVEIRMEIKELTTKEAAEEITNKTTDESILVAHLGEEGTQVLEADTDAEEVVFKTEEFSPFAVAKAGRLTGMPDYVKANITSTNGPDGKSFVIAAMDGTLTSRRAAIGKETGNDGSIQGLKGNLLGDIYSSDFLWQNDVTLTEYTFIKTNGNRYNIKTGDQYLRMNGSSLMLDNENRASDFTVIIQDNGCITLETTNNNNTQHINWYGNSASKEIFAGWNDRNDKNAKLTLFEPFNPDEQNDFLVYDLNIPTVIEQSYGYTWTPTPSLSEPSVQELTGDNLTVYGKPDGYTNDVGVSGQPGLYRFEIAGGDPIWALNKYLISINKEDDFPYYGEYRFDGWEYTDDDRNTYLIQPGTEIKKDAEGNYTVEAVMTEANGASTGESKTYTLSSVTILNGKWSEISNIATFYINYDGTILDTEGDVSGRNNTSFSEAVAYGRVYKGNMMVGSDGVYAHDANEIIINHFSFEYDPNNPNPQVVVDYLTIKEDDGSTSFYEPNKGANSSLLEETVLEYIRQTNQSIKISTPDSDKNPSIDPDSVNASDFTTRWYVLKEQTNGWHVDGVLVAKTHQIQVAKTFYGLTRKQMAEDMTDYAIDVKLGEKKEDYITLGRDDTGYDGIWSYNGFTYNEQAMSGTASWSMAAVPGQSYEFVEKNYDMPEYDCSPRVTIVDRTGGTSTTGSDTTDIPGVPDVIGGSTTGVYFNNFYTPEETGLFMLAKYDNTSAGGTGTMISGTEFTLTNTEDETALPQTSVTNQNGIAMFSDLREGTYILRESEASDGYAKTNDTWTVVVKEENNSITVTIQQNDENGDPTGKPITLFQTGEDDLEIYAIGNTPDDTTVRIIKHFEDISYAELRTLYENYQITVSHEWINGQTFNEYLKIPIEGKTPGSTEGGSETGGMTVYGEISDGGFTVTWVLHENHDPAVMDKDAFAYEIKETNFHHKDYVDTLVSAEHTANGVMLHKEEVTIIMPDADSGGSASFTLEPVVGQSNRVYINNQYIKEVELSLQKVDSVTEKPLPGAVFEIYTSDFQDAIPYPSEDPDVPAQIKKETFRDDNGSEQTFYYAGKMISDQDGIATMPGLKVSKDTGTKEFVYVLNEIQAANENYKLPEPKIFTIDIRNPAYTNGVFSVEMPNTLNTNTALRIEKKAKDNTLSIGPYNMVVDIRDYDGEKLPGAWSYPYKIYNSDGTEADNGEDKSISNTNNIIPLDIGQYAVITGIPQSFRYTVTEQLGKGYYPVYSVTAQGDQATALNAGGTILGIPKDSTDPPNQVIVTNQTDMPTDTISATVNKKWTGSLPEQLAQYTATMTLYREVTTFITESAVDNTGTTRTETRVEVFTPQGGSGGNPVTITGSGNYTWSNLPLYGESDVGDPEFYTYYVAETDVSGQNGETRKNFVVNYSGDTTSLTLADGSSVTAVQVAANGEVTVTNALIEYTLPESGGGGIYWYILSGLLLIGAVLMWKRILERKRERRVRP